MITFQLEEARVAYETGGRPALQLFLDNLQRVSHTYAADVLINLSDLDAKGALASGDRVMALTSGPATWGMIGVTKQPAR